MRLVGGMIKSILTILLFSHILLLAEAPGRVVILGFDGVDPKLTRQWLAAGQLPHLARLSGQGDFTNVATTNPAESPVAWTTFATGKNPGKHNIFGFLKRDPIAYRPELATVAIERRPLLGGNWGKAGLSLAMALVAGLLGLVLLRLVRSVWYRQRHLAASRAARLFAFGVTGLPLGIGCAYLLFACLPDELPRATPCKDGESFWTIAGRAGVTTVVLGAPMAFPAEEIPGGRLLCGLGVPDLSGTNGLWFHYSTASSGITPTETGGWKIELRPVVAAADADSGSSGQASCWQAVIIGPPDPFVVQEERRLRGQLAGSLPWAQLRDIQNRLSELSPRRYLQSQLNLRSIDAATVAIAIDGVTHDCRVGAWSDWYTVTFSASPILKLRGMARAFVFSANPPEVYLSPIELHPRHLLPGLAISYPPDYAAELADRVGLYPTLGWATATNPLKDDLISEAAFWQDLESTMACDTRKLLAELHRDDWRLLTAIFYQPDRASHMYFRFLDAEHARHAADSQEFAAYRDRLLQVYVWMDKVVGEVSATLRPNDTLFVLSDHGFAPFRWEVNLNRWLCDEGYLVLSAAADPAQRSQIIDLFTPDNPNLARFDWQKSRAYALGLGEIYLNLAGREAHGIVPQGEYTSLCEEIRRKLLALRHNGNPVAQAVYRRDEIYHGPHTEEASDLLLGFAYGYRVSWQTTLGNLAPTVVMPNLLKWSGDHCTVDPPLLPGVLFCNRKLTVPNPALADLAPTVLTLFGIKVPADMDGKVLLQK